MASDPVQILADTRVKDSGDESFAAYKRRLAKAQLAALREAGWRIAQVDEDWTDDEDGGECWAVTTEWKPEGGDDA